MRPFTWSEHSQHSFWDLLQQKWSTNEEQISELFIPIAPMVSVGKPCEILRELGGSRVYFNDSAWKAGVTELAHRATALLIRASGTSIPYNQLPKHFLSDTFGRIIKDRAMRLHYEMNKDIPYYNFHGLL